MERAGKPGDPWQEDAITAMLSFTADMQWACFEYAEICSRQNGKGWILEARALAGFLLLGETTIMWSAHEFKTATAAFKRMKALLIALGNKINENLYSVKLGDKRIGIKVNNSHGQEGFTRLDTKQEILFVARSKGSGRGFSGDVVIIDEAYAYTPDHQEALMPTMLAMDNPQIIYTSSPPLDGESGEPLFDLKERAESGDASEAEGLGYRDWGLAGFLEDRDKIKMEDPDVLAGCNPALGSRLTLGKLRALKKSMRSNRHKGYARECLGLWPKRIKGVGSISLSQWEDLKDAGSTRVGNVALGVDIAPDRSWAAIGLYALRADGKGHYHLLDYREGTDWLIARLVELKAAVNPLAIAFGTGTYKSIKTELADVGIKVPEKTAEKPHWGCAVVVGGQDMSAACSRTMDTIKQGAAWHKGQEELDEAVRVAKTRRAGDSIAWSRKDDEEGDITPLVAETVAQYAFEVIGPTVQKDYNLLDSIG